MITREQLQAMSDRRVSQTVAALVYGYPDDKDISRRIDSGDMNFCANPNDIMPLAFENNIWLQSVDAKNGLYWIAGANTWHAIHHENPLRAIACCLILVLQEQNK